jgi:hypothetical protein
MLAYSTNRGEAAFCPELKPPPRSFYEKELGKLGRPNRKGWASADPPCHESKSKKSFVVNLRSGSYRCWGCGIKGGDVIDFLRWREGYSFKRACQVLGCWTESGKTTKPKCTRVLSHLVMDFAIEGVQYQAEVQDRPKNDLELLRRIHAEAKDRLHEIRNGDAERVAGEEEIQWGIMAESWALIEMELTDYVR